MHHKVKILLVGPVQCGKTTLANFLGEAGEVGSGEYRPTKGCRIVEFEVPNVEVGGGATLATAEVELWDISGDRKFETTWPVMQRSAHGVVFVYNPSGGDQHSRYLQALYTQFVQQNGLKETQCMVFCHHKPGTTNGNTTLGVAGKVPRFTKILFPGGPFSRVPQMDSQLDEDGSRVRQDFAMFLGTILGQIVEASHNTENYIIG